MRERERVPSSGARAHAAALPSFPSFPASLADASREARALLPPHAALREGEGSWRARSSGGASPPGGLSRMGSMLGGASPTGGLRSGLAGLFSRVSLGASLAAPPQGSPKRVPSSASMRATRSARTRDGTAAASGRFSPPPFAQRESEATSLAGFIAGGGRARGAGGSPPSLGGGDSRRAAAQRGLALDDRGRLTLRVRVRGAAPQRRPADPGHVGASGAGRAAGGRRSVRIRFEPPLAKQLRKGGKALGCVMVARLLPDKLHA
jgi:hypothetical protein